MCAKMFDVPEGIADAVLAKMASKCAKGHFMRAGESRQGDWDSPMFHQPKEGRIQESGDMDVRILCACVHLNEHNKPHNWMKEFSPTVEGFLAEFLEEDVEFAKVDDYDAFENVKVEEGSQRFLHFVFRLRRKMYRYRALCMVQGCNTSALFYPVYKYVMFTRILGRIWQIWWASYQDDAIYSERAERQSCREAQGAIDDIQSVWDDSITKVL